MTQQELAERTSVSRQTINAIEQGKFNPDTVRVTLSVLPDDSREISY